MTLSLNDIRPRFYPCFNSKRISKLILSVSPTIFTCNVAYNRFVFGNFLALPSVTWGIPELVAEDAP